MTNNRAPDMTGTVAWLHECWCGDSIVESEEDCARKLEMWGGTITPLIRADLIKPEPVADLEAIKKNVYRNHLKNSGWTEDQIHEEEQDRPDDFEYGYQYGCMQAVENAIDHLYSQGHLRPAAIPKPGDIITYDNGDKYEVGHLRPAVPQDKGPWRAGRDKDGRPFFVASDDFEHDARLYVDGDFLNEEQENAYAVMIANKLNKTVPQEVIEKAHSILFAVAGSPILDNGPSSFAIINFKLIDEARETAAALKPYVEGSY